MNELAVKVRQRSTRVARELVSEGYASKQEILTVTTMTSSAKLGVVSALGILLVAGEAWAIPPLARKYGTSCQTCHVMIPKLNSFGEAVRLNGYQIPHAEELLVKDQPLQMGAEPWKQMWPDAMWLTALVSAASRLGARRSPCDEQIPYHRPVLS